MIWFPQTRHAWRRLKLLIAELLISGLIKGSHTYGHNKSLHDACEAIAEFREMYYPTLPSHKDNTP